MRKLFQRGVYTIMLNLKTVPKQAINNQTKKLQQAKEKLINKNYAEIYAHEAAHKSAAGELGGSIHIVKNSAGIPVSGFVPIKVPGVPSTKQPSLLDKTINQAKTVIKAAMAPKDPSSADFAVKANAEHTLHTAQNLKSKSKPSMDYMA